MDLLIKGMRLPKRGRKYPAVIFEKNGKWRILVETSITYDERHVKSYPISVVLPHGRLGDLDRLERMFADIENAPYSEFDGEDPFYSADDAARIIRLAPTIIPASEEEGPIITKASPASMGIYEPDEDTGY